MDGQPCRGLARLERQRSMMLRWAVRRIGDWHEGEDAVAELLAGAVNATLPDDPVELRRWWLSRLARLCRRRRQTRARDASRRAAPSTEPGSRRTWDDVLRSDEPGPEHEAVAAALWSRIEVALAQLSAAERHLLLRRAQGASLRELARPGEDRWVVLRRLRHARCRLVETLGPELTAVARGQSESVAPPATP